MTTGKRVTTMLSAGRRRRVLLAAVITISALVVASCSSGLPQSALNPKSSEAEQIDNLWILVFTLAVIVFVVVELMLVVAIFWFRKRRNDDSPEPKQTHGNTPLEIGWSIAPAIILAVIAVPTMITLFELSEPAEGADVVHVDVIGHQWWWEFRYPDIVDAQGRPLITANELHIPAGRTTELRMTSADVIHSFWVPTLAGKRDLVPGLETFIRITPEQALAGEQIVGQCAEFCWLGHADMRLLVFLDSEADFAAWTDDQLRPATIPTDGLAASGYEIFAALCVTCHEANVVDAEGEVQVVGPGVSADEEADDAEGAREYDLDRRVLAPDLTHFGSRETLGARVLTNTTDHLAEWLNDPSDVKAMAPELNDFDTGRILGMPDYGLDGEEIAELIELLEGWR